MIIKKSVLHGLRLDEIFDRAFVNWYTEVSAAGTVKVFCLQSKL